CPEGSEEPTGGGGGGGEGGEALSPLKKLPIAPRIPPPLAARATGGGACAGLGGRIAGAGLIGAGAPLGGGGAAARLRLISDFPGPAPSGMAAAPGAAPPGTMP